MSNNIQDILREINTSRAYDVYVPSLSTTVKFKPLIIEQIRNILENVTTETYFEIGFQNALITIISSNVITDNVDVSKFTEYDKLSIALFVRINDISPLYSNHDISNKKTEIVELQHPSSITITNDSIILVCDVPTLTLERNYNSYVLEKINNKTDNPAALKAVINVLLLAELAKYISSITINDIVTTQIDVFADWVKIVEVLPVSILKDVIDYIDSVKALREKILKINDTESIEFNLRLFTS
jgi:hypothetical protein